MSNRCRIDTKLTPEEGKARRIWGWDPGALCLINSSQLKKAVAVSDRKRAEHGFGEYRRRAVSTRGHAGLRRYLSSLKLLHTCFPWRFWCLGLSRWLSALVHNRHRKHTLEMGRIRFQSVRFQTPNSVSFCGEIKIFDQKPPTVEVSPT